MASFTAGRVAILSFQSHRDRSFLDDRELALLSGSLTQAGHDNDLVVTVLDDGGGPSAEAAQAKLTSLLCEYDVVLFERVWSADLIRRLREKAAHATFIWLRGEHELEHAPADWRCCGDLEAIVPALLDHLRGRAEHPPAGAFARRGDAFVSLGSETRAPSRPRLFAPNLAPRVVNPEALPALRIFSLHGNDGCAYQVDARTNPLYAGTDLPEGVGRGCAFCTTGNHYAGHPPAAVAASVAGEIRYVRRHGPTLRHLVLVDQNPFPYLPELLRVVAHDALGGFTLFLETRADWFVRSRKRFEEALEIAREAGITLAPFLVGIENFSQAELDRFNKGMSAEEIVAFLEALWDWVERYSPVMTLEHAAFGFILLTPWTSMEDLRVNLAGIRRTRLDRLRGSLLVSRARLYPDAALYYLARRDGLLTEAFSSVEEDNSRRYGYYPCHPWRYRHPEVAHFSALAAELTRRLGGRDQVRLFQALLEAFDAAGPDWARLTSDDVLRAARAAPEGRGRPVRTG